MSTNKKYVITILSTDGEIVDVKMDGIGASADERRDSANALRQVADILDADCKETH